MLIKQKGKCDGITSRDILEDDDPELSQKKDWQQQAQRKHAADRDANLAETIVWKLTPSTEQQQKVPCNTVGNETWWSLESPFRDLEGNAFPSLSVPKAPVCRTETPWPARMGCIVILPMGQSRARYGRPTCDRCLHEGNGQNFWCPRA